MREYKYPFLIRISNGDLAVVGKCCIFITALSTFKITDSVLLKMSPHSAFSQVSGFVLQDHFKTQFFNGDKS